MSASILRVIHVLRFNSLLINCSNQLKLAMEALKKSRSAAWKLLVFLFLIIYIYALMGVAAFNRVPNLFPINENVSFRTFGQSLLLLFQISTSAAWDRVYEVLISDPNKSAFLIFVYLVSFLFISFLVIVNLVATVVLNYYLEASENENKGKELRDSDLNDFNDKWQSIAGSENPLFIKKTQLRNLLDRLGATSALRFNTPLNDEKINLLGIPVRNEDQYYRGDVLIALNRFRLSRLANQN